MNGDLNKPVATPTPPPQKKKNNFVVIFILLLLIGGFLTLIMFLRPKESTKQPSNPPVTSLSDTTLIATVDGKEIFLGDIKNIAREQYTEAAIDNAALKTSLDIIIERRLLDREAKNRTVTITDQELQDTLANIPLQLTTSKRYELLREKLTPLLVKSRKAYTVGFWLAPEGYSGGALSPTQQSALEQEHKDALPALQEIEKQFRVGKEPLSIAKATVQKYPSLEQIITVNGYYIARIEDETQLMQPQMYILSSDQTNEVVKKIFELNAGEIELVHNTKTNAGGAVIHVLEVSNGQYDNYADWLKDIRGKLVTVHQDL